MQPRWIMRSKRKVLASVCVPSGPYLSLLVGVGLGVVGVCLFGWGGFFFFFFFFFFWVCVFFFFFFFFVLGGGEWGGGGGGIGY